MATKKIKDYGDALYGRSTGRVAKKQREVDDAFRIFKRNQNHSNHVKYQRKKADLAAAKIDARRLQRKKPKGMSRSEWMKQIGTGKAMVQNPNEAKTRLPRYGSAWSSTHDGYDNEVKKEGRQQKEFIITTVPDPKKLPDRTRTKRTKDTKAKRVLREMAAKKEGK
tara:strand:+ start:3764 stop:4261 length:498 start_codon:yes stop_codon:yes gene_type:complete